jgi:hypothetical protein
LARKIERDQTTSEESDAIRHLYQTWEQQRMIQEQDPAWRDNNLEWDLRSTAWICEKVKNSADYAQNLYAAMCNNEFQRQEVLPILRDQRWSCSWRYAGGIVADMREEGDYMDYYCTGIHGGDGYVSESVVTDQIRQDLLELGWIVVIEE